MKSIEDIRAFVANEILKSKDIALPDDRPLIQDGLLNSIDVMRLITHLSDHFGVQFQDDDYSLENFETINSIFALARKRLPVAMEVAP